MAPFPVAEAERGDVIAPWGEERRLLARIRSGDRAAAEELVERTYSAVYASLFRLCGDGDMAADLTQETYQKAWAALPRFDGRSQLFTWLYRIAYTTFLNTIRRPRRITSLDDEDAPEMPADEPQIDDLIAGRETDARLRQGVLGLPEDLRFTVTAHFWGELSVGEIARIEGITAVAIRKRLKKAFAILGPLLEEDMA